MQINNWIDFIILGIVVFAIILIGFPTSIYLIKKAIEGFVKYKFKKLPKGFLIAPGLGTYSLEVLFYGLFLFSFAIWALFFYEGGQLLNLIHKINDFTSTK